MTFRKTREERRRKPCRGLPRPATQGEGLRSFSPSSRCPQKSRSSPSKGAHFSSLHPGPPEDGSALFKPSPRALRRWERTFQAFTQGPQKMGAHFSSLHPLRGCRTFTQGEGSPTALRKARPPGRSLPSPDQLQRRHSDRGARRPKPRSQNPPDDFALGDGAPCPTRQPQLPNGATAPQQRSSACMIARSVCS